MKRAVVVLACCFAGVTAHAETRPEYTGKAEASLLGAPATFDPAAAQTHAELTIAELVFDTLYRVELTGAIEPHVAAGPPELDPTRLVARIAIRKGITFHDGSALHPQDVAASLDRARRGPGRWALSPIAKVSANGDSIEITLKTPIDVAMMLALAPSSVTRNGKAPGGRAIGSGPFEIESVAKNRLVVKAFEDHFAGRPYLDRLVLHWYDNPDAEAKRFELDETQLSARGATQFFGGQPKYRAGAVDGPKALLVFIGFGKKHRDVTGDVGFRKALELALDRGAATSVNKGEAVIPAGEPVPVEAGGTAPTQLVRNGNVPQARLALADAARRVHALTPAKRPQLTLEIAFESTRPDDRQIAERVARALGKLDIGATLTGVSATELRDRVSRGATDLWIGQLAAPIKSGTSWPWWSAAFAIGGDDWAAARLADGTLTNQAARHELAARRPIVPLMFRGVKMWHRADLRGLRFDAMGRPCFAEMFVFGQPIKAVATP